MPLCMWHHQVQRMLPIWGVVEKLLSFVKLVILREVLQASISSYTCALGGVPWLQGGGRNACSRSSERRDWFGLLKKQLLNGSNSLDRPVGHNLKWSGRIAAKSTHIIFWGTPYLPSWYPSPKKWKQIVLLSNDLLDFLKPLSLIWLQQLCLRMRHYCLHSLLSLPPKSHVYSWLLCN